MSRFTDTFLIVKRLKNFINMLTKQGDSLSMTKKKWSIIKIIMTTWITIGIASTLLLLYLNQSHAVEEQLLQNSPAIHVENTDDFYAFIPTDDFQKIFIFYPGAMVDPKAY